MSLVCFLCSQLTGSVGMSSQSLHVNKNKLCKSKKDEKTLFTHPESKLAGWLLPNLQVCLLINLAVWCHVCKLVMVLTMLLHPLVVAV